MEHNQPDSALLSEPFLIMFEFLFYWGILDYERKLQHTSLLSFPRKRHMTGVQACTSLINFCVKNLVLSQGKLT